MCGTIIDDGEKYIISPSSVLLLQGTRADGAVINRYIQTFNDNKVTIIFREEELNVKGNAKYKIVIEDGDTKLSSFYFKIKVYENVYNSDGIIANPDIDILESTIKKANETISKANETIEEMNNLMTPITNDEIDILFSQYMGN